jgi:hypothetical protein
MYSLNQVSVTAGQDQFGVVQREAALGAAVLVAGGQEAGDVGVLDVSPIGGGCPVATR